MAKCYEFKGRIFQSKKELHQFMKIDFIMNGAANVAPREVNLDPSLREEFSREFEIDNAQVQAVVTFPDGEVITRKVESLDESITPDELLQNTLNDETTEETQETETTEEPINKDQLHKEIHDKRIKEILLRDYYYYPEDHDDMSDDPPIKITEENLDIDFIKDKQLAIKDGNKYIIASFPVDELRINLSEGSYLEMWGIQELYDNITKYRDDNTDSELKALEEKYEEIIKEYGSDTTSPTPQTETTEEVKTSEKIIAYTPKGKPRQTYTIVGNKIFNKNNVEVFKGDSVDRNRIFANLAVREGRAEVVEHKGASYVVNNRNIIISVATGKIMQWGEENGDRKAILEKVKFNNDTNQISPTSHTKAPLGRYELFPNIFANQDQKEAIDKMNNFLSSKDNRRVFMLRGRGGTGKTTIIKKVVESIKKSNPNKNIAYVAPTHKAKEVLSRSVGKEAMTLASGLSVDLNKKTGEFKPNSWKRKQFGIPLQKYSIIIIDEGSMIGDSNLDDLLKEVPSSTKIIIMGDNVQLPPVGQGSDSKVFKYEGANLKERMRQGEESPIVPITDIVANNVESEAPVIRAIKDRTGDFNITDNEGVLFLNNMDHVLHYFEQDYKKHPESTKVITYNNENYTRSELSVLKMNPKIREKIFGEKAKEEIIEGEQLMAYDTFLPNQETDPEPTIQNAVDYTVVKIHEKVSEFKVTVLTDSKYGPIQKLDLPLSGYIVDLKNNITGEVSDKNKKMFIPDNRSKKLINNTASKFFEQKNNTLAYAVKDAAPNLHYGYAITTHKAQGSTYRNAYVLEDNILGRTNQSSVKEKNQALYVAVSRPSHKLVILSEKNTQKINAYRTEEEEKNTVRDHVEVVKEIEGERKKEAQEKRADQALLKTKNKDGEPIVKKDCSFAAFGDINKPADIKKAKDGMREASFYEGFEWKVVKDLKGHPSHAKGGVNVKITDNGVMLSRKDGKIKAKHGLVIPCGCKK